LLYGTTHVPVGEDQAQHLEFTRELANGFNHQHGQDLFPVPETILSPAKRVMSLRDPTKKMSKSDANPASRILITDTQEEIRKKVKGAVTDSIEGVSYDRSTRPGVSNLIDLMYYMDETISSSPEALAAELKTTSMRVLKEKVADVVEERVRPIRESYNIAMARPDTGKDSLREVQELGADKAASIASDKINEVKRRMGLGYW
jgi:tryptophanyl-tRNA synthetase